MRIAEEELAARREGFYRAQSPYYAGATAGYRGQIGRNASIPHAHRNTIVFRPATCS